jgi:hypothetical protein
VNEALPEGSWHRSVELRHHRLRGADRRVHRLDRRAERTEAVRVGWRHVDEHRVERKQATVEQDRHVTQEDRDELGAPFVDRSSSVRADEQSAVPEVRSHLGREMRPGAFRVQMDHRHVAQLRRPRDERVEQDRRDGCGALQIDLVARTDVRDGLFGADDSHQGPPRAGALSVPYPAGAWR